jgi:HlyD family secretion protein
VRLIKSPRLIIGVAVVAVIVAVAMWPRPIEVDVATVTRGPMQVTIDEEGETRVRERFVVSAPVTGRLERIELENGDQVVGGKSVVARLMPAQAPLIDPRTQAELRAAVDAAQAVVGQAQSERARAVTVRTRSQSTVRRLEMLLKSGAISGDELEAAQATLKSGEDAVRAAEYTVARAEHELQIARARLRPSSTGGSTVNVIAPVSGVVLKRLHESASVVPVGEPLLEIGDPASLEIVSDLLSTDAVRVSRGDAVVIEQWGGPHPLDGRVRLVEPSGFMKVSALGVEEQRVNVIVDFADDTEPAALGDGYRVEVRIITWRADSALTAPIGALFRQGQGWAVFTIEGGRARRRVVHVDQRNDRDAHILHGLTEAEAVVLHPPDTLTDGARVRIRNQ